VVTACDYMAVRFGTLNTDFLCGLISSSRACAWITAMRKLFFQLALARHLAAVRRSCPEVRMWEVSELNTFSLASRS
jgi:hypothetical protein